MAIVKNLKIWSIVSTTSKGIDKTMWDYHYRLGYLHGERDAYNTIFSPSNEQKQAYTAGYYKGNKEYNLRQLLKGNTNVL